MKSLIAKSLGTAALALAVVFGAPSARAGASFDFLFQMDRVSDDRQLFLNLAVSNYGYDQAVLEPVLPRIQYVEVDLPVVLFLAHESGRPPDYIVDLRAGGLSWSAVFTKESTRTPAHPMGTPMATGRKIRARRVSPTPTSPAWCRSRSAPASRASVPSTWREPVETAGRSSLSWPRRRAAPITITPASRPSHEARTARRGKAEGGTDPHLQ